MTIVQLGSRSQCATIVQKVVIMPILVAPDREVIVNDVERGTSVSHAESATVLLASPRTRSFTDGRGVGPTGTACSEPTMADGPGGRSALRAG